MNKIEIELLEEGGGLNIGSFGTRVLTNGTIFLVQVLVGELSREVELPGKPAADTLRQLLSAANRIASLHIPSQRFGPDVFTISDP